MNKLRQSYDGIKCMVTNVIAFVAGNNDEPSDSSLSSGEIVECDSDCSQCGSDSKSISMNGSSSHNHSKHLKQGNEEAVEDLVQSLQQSSVKRRKRNSSSSGGGIEEEQRSGSKKKDDSNEVIVLKTSNLGSSSKLGGSKRGKNNIIYSKFDK